MKRFNAFVLALVLISSLWPTVTVAQQQTLPANTVLGRLGIGSGPAQAIPFPTLSNQLFPFIAGSRLKYTSAPTIYVNGTGAPATCGANTASASFTCAVGSDTTGNGTTAAPYQTLVQALLVVKSFDFAGFTPTIVLAYGSSTNYAGSCTGGTPGSQATGGSAIFISGDSNSPTSVSILSPNSGEGVYASDGCILRLQNLVLDNQGTAIDGLRVGQGAIVDVQNISCGSSWNSASGSCVAIEKNGVLNLVNVGVNELGCGASLFNMSGGVLNAAQVNPPFTLRTIAIPSAITCSTATLIASGHAHVMNFNSSTFAGSGVSGTTGVRAALSGNAYVDTGGSGINSTFPGNSSATLSGSAQTDTGDTLTTPIPIASGGTAAGSAGAARTSLGVPGLSGGNTFSGNQTFSGQIIPAYGTPTIASGTCGATTNGTLAAGSTNQSGEVIIASASTTTCTISFSTTLSAAPLACILEPGNAQAATELANSYISAITTGHFVITGSALASTDYYYHCL